MREDSDILDVVVETPSGSRNKYEMDLSRGLIRLDRRLPSATVYPADYGYVPETMGEDGDPLDAMVLLEDRAFPGCLVRSRLVGLFKMSDEKGGDSKLITVPEWEPRWSDTRDVGDLPQHLLAEIEHFFSVYKDLQPTANPKIEGFASLSEARAELKAACKRYDSAGSSRAD